VGNEGISYETCVLPLISLLLIGVWRLEFGHSNPNLGQPPLCTRRGSALGITFHFILDYLAGATGAEQTHAGQETIISASVLFVGHRPYQRTFVQNI
jgi:hypothetical protein